MVGGALATGQEDVLKPTLICNQLAGYCIRCQGIALQLRGIVQIYALLFYYRYSIIFSCRCSAVIKNCITLFKAELAQKVQYNMIS